MRPPPLPQARSTPPPLPRARPVVAPPRQWRHFQPRDFRRFKNLLLVARTLAEGAYSGKHRSPFRGSSPEFVEFRTYNPGDPLDSVDWKAFARTDRHYIRLTEKETDLPCHLLLDCSASMAYAGDPAAGGRKGEERVSKLDYACRLTAALVYLLVKQGDRVGLTLFDEKVRQHIPPGGTFRHLYRTLNVLEKQKPGGHTALPAALDQARALLKRRGLLIIISDFYGETDKLLRALSAFSGRGHEVLLFHLLHEHERTLPAGGPAQFVDAETGEALVCHPEEVRARYEAALGAFITKLRRGAGGHRMGYQLLDTSVPFHVPLRRYLAERQARMR